MSSNAVKQSAILVLAVALLSLAPTAQAATITSYRVDTFINADRTVHSVVNMEFDEPIAHLEYKLNFRIFNLVARSSFDFTDCTSQDADGASGISCTFVGIPPTNILRLDFDSQGDISRVNDTYQLSIDYSISVPVDRKIVAIRLPEGGILAGEVANASYYPGHGEVFTDGRRIGILWRFDNATEETRFLVLYSVTEPAIVLPEYLLIISVVAVVAVLGGLYLYFSHKKVTGKAEAFKTVLNQDEKRIVDILMKNSGKVYQKILVRETDFSKAKVSRLVRSLQKRGVVAVEPVSGRENRVVLRLEKGKEEHGQRQEPEGG